MQTTEITDTRPGQDGLTIDDIPNCSVSDRMVLGLINDDEVDLAQIAGIIEENPSLTILIIGLANSAFFSAPKPIHSVTDAIINVLGLRMVRNIILSVVLGRSVDTSACPEFSITDYWTDALTTGRFCQMLAARGGFKVRFDSDLAYLGGLLAQFGQLVLVNHFPDPMNSLLKESRNNIDQMILAQQQQLGVNQSQAGGLMGRRWMLTPEVVTCMQHCFNDDYHGPNWELTVLVSAAARLVDASREMAEPLTWPAGLAAIMDTPPDDHMLTLLPVFREEIKAIAVHLANTK
jgi:HD-like signal output (HDOD) protein